MVKRCCLILTNDTQTWNVFNFKFPAVFFITILTVTFWSWKSLASTSVKLRLCAVNGRWTLTRLILCSTWITKLRCEWRESISLRWFWFSQSGTHTKAQSSYQSTTQSIVLAVNRWERDVSKFLLHLENQVHWPYTCQWKDGKRSVYPHALSEVREVIFKSFHTHIMLDYRTVASFLYFLSL